MSFFFLDSITHLEYRRHQVLVGDLFPDIRLLTLNSVQKSSASSTTGSSSASAASPTKASLGRKRSESQPGSLFAAAIGVAMAAVLGGGV